jgi:hypothetical protein
MRLFVGDDTALALWVIRAANAAISIGLLIVAASLLRPIEGRRLALYWLVAAVPLTAFLFASSNPSATSIAGTAAGFVAFIAVLRCSLGPRGYGASIIAAASMAMACLSRADAVYFCALGMAVALLDAGSQVRSRIAKTAWLAAPSVAVVGAALIATSQRDLAASEMLGVDSGRPGSPGAAANLVGVPLLYFGELPTRLGWLDTPTPGIVGAGTAVAVLLVALGTRAGGFSRVVSILALGAALVMVPLFALETAEAAVGAAVQPRYLMPMVYMGHRASGAGSREPVPIQSTAHCHLDCSLARGGSAHPDASEHHGT